MSQAPQWRLAIQFPNQQALSIRRRGSLEVYVLNIIQEEAAFRVAVAVAASLRGEQVKLRYGLSNGMVVLDGAATIGRL